MDGTEQADSLLTVAVQHKLQWCWPGRAGMAAWEGCASKPAVPHPWGGTPRLKVPNSHSLLAADSIRSFLGILSSHCIRKKNKCLNREVSPSPSGREGSFSSCLYPWSSSSPLCNLALSRPMNAPWITPTLELVLPCEGTKFVQGRGKSVVSAGFTSKSSEFLIIGPATG